METSVTLELQEITRKIEALAVQRDDAEKALRLAREEISDLQLELELTREELHKKTLDVEFLTVSHKLADTPGALADARASVKRMLGRVDKALALLRDDARI